MPRELLFVLLLLGLGGCGRQAVPDTDYPNHGMKTAPATRKPATLLEERRGFQTRLLRQEAAKEPVPTPPANLFQTVHYDSPAGKLAAYLSVPPKDGKKHPAIVWIFGGFDNGIGETAWEPQSPDNDQSASAFRQAGILMLYPSFRGGNDNPGFRENFYGEVDDVLAAVKFLEKQPSVDPNRIYLGGHSTGGTLALLAAACGKRFRAVFAFGPAGDVGGYGPDSLVFDYNNPRELDLRAPERWLPAIESPTFVFEGGEGNADSLQAMAQQNHNRQVSFYLVRGASHFSILAPITKHIAAKVAQDTGPKTNLAFSENELNGLMSPAP